ncbi:MAG: hypothetical protein WCE84_01455 [Candidatus Rhabdochlamydia sp.]|jgi:hypothetical protein
MLSPLKAFTCVQKITGCSFLFSNLSKNMNNIALPAIALASGMYMVVNAENITKSFLVEDFTYEDCVSNCVEWTVKMKLTLYKDFVDELGACLRMCVNEFPIKPHSFLYLRG